MGAGWLPSTRSARGGDKRKPAAPAASPQERVGGEERATKWRRMRDEAAVDERYGEGAAGMRKPSQAFHLSAFRLSATRRLET